MAADFIQHDWEENEKQNRRKGLVTSGVVHAIIIIICLLFGLSSVFPPPVEGILVNFGTMKTGSGNEPPKVEKQEEVAPVEKSEPMPVVEQEETPAEVVTQDAFEAPAVEKPVEKKEPKKEPEKKKEVKPQPKPEPVKEEPKKPVKEEAKEPVKEEPKVDSKSLYTGQKSDENKPGSEGKTYTPGDQGDPKGDPSSKNYEGETKGLGNIGVGYDLTGRNLLDIPPIDKHYDEPGKVVVQIKVDRNGRVILAKYTVKGSTTTDPTLIALAEKAAREAKFTSNPNAPEEQFGSISFTFKMK